MLWLYDDEIRSQVRKVNRWCNIGNVIRLWLERVWWVDRNRVCDIGWNYFVYLKYVNGLMVCELITYMWYWWKMMVLIFKILERLIIKYWVHVIRKIFRFWRIYQKNLVLQCIFICIEKCIWLLLKKKIISSIFIWKISSYNHLSLSKKDTYQ